MKQITVVVDNRPGIVADISKLLGDRGVNIETLDAEGVEDHGVLVLTVDKYDEALRALRDAAYNAITEDAIVVRLKDEPGALGKIAVRFKDANINLRSVRFMKREGGYSLIALSADNSAEARELVKDVAVD